MADGSKTETEQVMWGEVARESDTLDLVRCYCWAGAFSTSSDSIQMVKVPLAIFERLRNFAVFAAYMDKVELRNMKHI